MVNSQVFYSLGDDKAYQPPSCVSWGNKRVDCVYHGPEGHVYQHPIINGVSQPVKGAGGIAYRRVNCVAMGEEQVRCIIVGHDNNIFTAELNGETWSEWKSFGRSVNEIGDSSCISRDAGLFECVVLLQKDKPGFIEVKNGALGNIQMLDYNFRTPFSCAAPTKTSLYCYSVMYSNALCFFEWTEAEGWSKKQPLKLGTIEVTSEPHVVRSSEDVHHILAMNDNYNMFHVKWTKGSGHSKIAPIEGLVLSNAPDCLSVNDQDVYCFALGMDHVLYKIRYDGEQWSEWEMVGGVFLEKPSCSLSETKQITCVMRSFHSTLVQTIFTLP